MGNWLSGKSDTKIKDKKISASKKEIQSLLSELNSTSTKEDEFKITRRYEVDTTELERSLDKIKEHETFKQFNTYQFICDMMPLFVLSKEKLVDDNSKHHHYYGVPQYYDIYGPG
eukprot:868849_1